MALVDLAIAKAHLRLPDPSDTSEDALLTVYIEAVEAHIARKIDADIPDPPPADLKLAALLYLTDLYENRGANMELAGGVQLVENPAAEAYIFPHRMKIGM